MGDSLDLDALDAAYAEAIEGDLDVLDTILAAMPSIIARLRAAEEYHAYLVNHHYSSRAEGCAECRFIAAYRAATAKEDG